MNIYNRNVNPNFETITEGKGYKSGAFHPDEIAGYIRKYHIKSNMNRRMAETYDLTLNLEKIREVQAENNTVAKTNGINYFSNPIEQVQKKEKIETFAKIMDNSDNYSVLIYRQHGTERAEIYSALYRTE